MTLQPIRRYRLRRGDPVQRHPDAALGARPGAAITARARARCCRRCAMRPAWTALDPARVAGSDRADPGDGAAGPRRCCRGALPNVTLIGFAGAPFTVACYMVEGGGSKDFAAHAAMAYAQPELFDRLIALLTEATIEYLAAQVEAGAEALMLFDSWAGVLSPSQFRRYVIEPDAGDRGGAEGSVIPSVP